MVISSDSSNSALLLEQMGTIIGENDALRENLNNLMTMFAREDVGWLKISGGGWDDDHGLSLDDLHDWSEQIREAMAGNPWIKQGWNLRSTFVFEGGVHRDNIPGKGRGRGIDVQSRVDNATNQKNFFGESACHEREGALYSDSQVFYIGDDSSYTLHHVPIWEVTGDIRDPDYPDEVWAYRRSYMVPVTDSFVRRESRVEWIFRNGYLDKRPKSMSVNYNGVSEPVAKTKRMFGNPVNAQIGWAYGVPDALAALIWARIYRDAMMDGRTMTQALASLAFNVSVGSRAAGENAAVKLSQPGVAGTSILGAGNELNAVSTAGKAYDFDALRPILAAAAAALQVSVVALASDPGAAGSSYGSAQTLDLPSRLAIAARRQYHVALETEVLQWLGAPEPHVWFDSLEDASSIYRQLQAWVLKWNSGLYEPEDAKRELESIFGREFFGDIPDGVLLPNNKDSQQRSDIDPVEVPSQAGGAGQGQANGTGGQGGGLGNDIREAFSGLQSSRVEEILEELLDMMRKQG